MPSSLRSLTRGGRSVWVFELETAETARGGSFGPQAETAKRPKTAKIERGYFMSVQRLYIIASRAFYADRYTYGYFQKLHQVTGRSGHKLKRYFVRNSKPEIPHRDDQIIRQVELFKLAAQP